MMKAQDMKMNKHKLVVFDIDGVLNEHGGNIMDESIQAIDLLKRNNIHVCYASGKHAWYIQGGLVWSGLLDDNTIIVAENGGVIFDPNTRRTLNEDKYLRDVILLRNIFRNLHSRDKGFLRFAGITIWEEPKETLFCLFPKEIGDLEKLQMNLQEIVALNNLNLTVVRNPDSIDVLQSGINKATGLGHLCQWLNLEPKDIIAFGDSYNDQEMLAYVDYPITLSNAKVEIKELVKNRGGYISNLRAGKGVLEAVNYLIKSELL